MIDIPQLPPEKAHGIPYEVVYLNYYAAIQQNRRLIQVLKTRDFTIQVLLHELDKSEQECQPTQK